VNEASIQPFNGGAVDAFVPSLLLPAPAAIGTWSPIGPPDGATVRVLAFAPSQPSVVYAGLFGGGVHRSDDGGATWRPAGSGLGNPVVNALAVDPTNPDHVYAATDAGFFRSVNGGGQWRGSDPFGILKCYSLAIDPASPQVLYLGTALGLFRSDSAGAGWQPLTTGLIPAFRHDFEVVALAIDPLRPRIVYAAHLGVHQSVHKTYNGGRMWVQVLRARIGSLAVDPVDDSVVWAAGAGVFRSADGGRTFSEVRVEVGSDSTLVIDPSDHTRVYAASTRGLQVTTDGGQTWQTLPGPLPGQGVLSLAADPSAPGTLLAGTSGAGVFRSTDSGSSWANSSQGLVNTSVLGMAFDGADGALFVAANPGIYRTRDGGATWSLTTFGGGSAVAIAGAPSNPRTLYGAIASPTQIVRSVDGGDSWQVVSNQAASALAVALDDAATVYAATPQALMKSTDGGATWTAVFQGEVDHVLADPLAPEAIYLIAANAGLLWESRDRGATWEVLLRDGFLHGLAVGQDTPRTILTSDARSVFGSNDGGKTWSVLAGTRVLPLALAVDPKDARVLYVGSEAGVERSADGGVTWQFFSKGLYARGFNQLVFDPNDPSRLYAASELAGLFVVDLQH
jgi:photosystem II stability/assembly factor-like uncharacterized protein